MQSTLSTPDEYIASLPEDRRQAIATLRTLIRKNIPSGYEEGMQYGMIAYYIPLERYPNTYNGQPLQYVALASQKNYMSLYLLGIYGQQESDFRQRYQATGKKLNMGKSCLRFASLDDLPLDLIANTIAEISPEKYIELYEQNRNIR